MSFKDLNTEIENLKSHLSVRESFSENDLRIVVSPIRLSLLGSELGIQGGPALAHTINAYSILAFIPVNNRKITLYSLNDPGIAEFDPKNVKSAEKTDWRRFIMGAAKLFTERYSAERGFTGVISRTLPGRGLGTSSSECLSYLKALSHTNEIDPLTWEYAEFTTRIKYDYLKEHGTSLDPLTALNGRKDSILHVLTSTGEVSAHPGPKHGKDFKIAVFYSGDPGDDNPEKRELALKDYREVSGFLGIMAGLSSGDRLSDIPHEIYYKNEKRLPPKLKKRASYYFNEADRVAEGLSTWRKGDLESFGRLMTESANAAIDSESGTSVGTVMLHRVLSFETTVFGSNINGDYIGAIVSPEFSKHTADEILGRYFKLCPEAEGRAGFNFAEPEESLRIQ